MVKLKFVFRLPGPARECQVMAQADRLSRVKLELCPVCWCLWYQLQTVLIFAGYGGNNQPNNIVRMGIRRREKGGEWRGGGKFSEMKKREEKGSCGE